MIQISAIASYHAHIYYRDEAAKALAAELRERIGERFSVQLGRWHDRLIGPHALPMYQVAFSVELFPSFVPFLMLNRMGLPVLIHPNTINPRQDHLKNAMWLGEILPIMHPEALPEHDMEDFLSPVVPNTAPSLTP